MTEVELSSRPLSLSELRRIWGGPVKLSLSEEAIEAIRAAQATVDAVIEGGEQVYGVNTGFGLLANVRISGDELGVLQENLIRSHSVGVGPLLPDQIVRLVMVTKIKALAQGNSGVRLELVEAMIELVNRGIYPTIPSKGSVGASGDLAPLAHMAGILIGIGHAQVDGIQVSASDALRTAGLDPVQLAPKEGLALLNGTQVSTAIALAAAFRTENLLAAAITAGAMAADAIKGSDTPFDDRIHAARGHDSQSDVARMLRELLHGSTIRASHLDCDRVQDPYSIRCQPQVAGACLGVLRHVCQVLQTEANAVTDNPLVFADTGSILSGGNFHAEPVAFAADYLALAIAELGSISERRIALLVDPHMSGLPAFLVRDSGLNSGFMIVQITSAALVSENKSLAHPASVDSIPTSANQEDHVSMATFAANRLHTMLDNANNVIAIELLATAQGLDFHHPEESSTLLENAYAKIRALSPALEQDRSLKPDIDAVAASIDAGAYREYCADLMPSLAE